MVKFILFSFMLFSCDLCAENDGVIDDVCGYGKEGALCKIPFDLVYTHRKSFVGRKIQLNGFLLAGSQFESSSSNESLILLFPSTERAEICEIRYAIEIFPDSDQMLNELIGLSGWVVSISGEFHRNLTGHYWSSGRFWSVSRHWGGIDVSSEPVRIFNNMENLSRNCLVPPVPPPEPPRHERVQSNHGRPSPV